MYLFSSNYIKEFPSKYSYRITREDELGKGHVNGYVYLYKIEYFLNNNIVQTLYLAGKIISKSVFKEEEIKYKKLKKVGIISYVLRKFSSTNSIECTNFNNNYLNKMVFLSDLTLNNLNVSPINIRDKLNLTLINTLSFDKKEIMLTKALNDMVILLKNNLFIRQFDIWFLIYNSNEFRLEIVDMDFLIEIGSNQDKYINKKNLRNMFLNILHTNKEIELIFKNILNSSNYYDEMLTFYGINKNNDLI
ncbi:MAG: hypothetical protein LAT82_05240 [Nanoarchaeota archaeon]|nr:hypothetical protein [Nanoarchaeota archaeon]